ncbi:16S rRNA (guanine(527)-N(7))-methyltransferase RsmG [Ectothiorhodospiraceae bacterium WFHF3C12]|nr:16S rRNA (guanine(527)-N(7))-methyltransferase RsmG [Ectothiorhodospiraceae bacterium WFHF3C12]
MAESVPAVAARLASGLEALDLELPAGLPRRLLAYLGLLSRWNRAYNLSAIRDPEEMVTRHILDSLAVLPHVAGPRVLDVGTGAGLPGLVLALARPDWQLTLLDSNAKKVTFLRQARLELGIDNIHPEQARVERFAALGAFDTVISRAYGSLRLFYRQTAPLCAPGGRLVAMKGRLPQSEIAELADDEVTFRSHRLTVPGLEAERHVIIMDPEHSPTGMG